MNRRSLFDEPATSTQASAVLSPCGRYRYRLERRWAPGPAVVFVMLNPSTADHQADDPTIRRCLGFARAWGYDALVVVNLFAWRATEPAQLPAERELAVGPEADAHLLEAARSTDLVVCAWGVHGVRFGRDQEVLGLLRGAGVEPMCVGVSKEGHPRHPLYVRAGLKPLAL